MKLTTSWARAASKESSSNGSSSAAPTRTSADGSLARQTETNAWEGSTAATFSLPTTFASAVASPPGPQPTSSTRFSESIPVTSISAAASSAAYRPTKRPYMSVAARKVETPLASVTDAIVLLRWSALRGERVEQRPVLLDLIDDVLAGDVRARIVEERDQLRAGFPRPEPLGIGALGDHEVVVEDPALPEHPRDQLMDERQRRLGRIPDVVLERGPLALPLMDVQARLPRHALTVPVALFSNTRMRQ